MSRKAIAVAVFGFGLLLLAQPAAWGQGLLVIESHRHPLPRLRVRPSPPPVSYKIKEIAINARVVDQTAKVQTSQSFVNTGSQQMEVSFVFPVPYDAAVEQMTLLVDGKEFSAQVMPADKAREIYEGYVQRNKDPALLEWVGSGMLKTSVFPVPAGATRTVTLRYSQLLRKDHEVTEILFPLSTAKYTSDPVEKLSVRVAIESSTKIKNIYSPTHPVEADRSGGKHATVVFEAENETPSNDFRLFYDVSDEKLGASLLSYRPEGEQGYFLLMASPDIQDSGEQQPVAKTVVFVVDRSGSMSGKKIEQAKEALRFVLNNLRDGDLFNVIAYDQEVESFRGELQRYEQDSRQAALAFVDGLYAGGSTNIDAALTTALESLKDDSRPSYVIFLTDGLPTAGEQNEMKIAQNARQHNDVRARILSFGVGYDVNSRLLDRLTDENFGISHYVRPDEDIEAHVSELYQRIREPVMTDVQVTIDVEGASGEQQEINRVYPKSVTDLFAGQQLVLVGRYKQPGTARVTIEGQVGGERMQFDFGGELEEKSSDEKYAFVEKLWAMRRIGEIIDELDLRGENEELIEELVRLSTEHGILTPYTSFLADENESHDLAGSAQFFYDEAEVRLRRLRETGGQSGVTQRAVKQALRSSSAADAGGGFGGMPSSSARSGRGFGGAAPAEESESVEKLGTRANQAARYVDIDSDQEVVADTVLNIGKQTLYKRGDLWIAANARDVDPEKEREKIEEVERFGKRYFELVRHTTASENAVLAQQQEDEQLLIRLRDQVYLIK